MPVLGPLKPINVTVVPVKVTVAREPVTADETALPPLHVVVIPAGVQPEPNATAPDDSSIRVPSTVGGVEGPASKASTTTALSLADAFFRPVASTTMVWVPAARPLAVNTGACGCSPGMYRSTSPKNAASR